MWRSLVAHLHGVQGVEGSNPFTPTKNDEGLATQVANPFVFSGGLQASNNVDVVQLKLALLSVGKVVLQSFLDGAKCNLVPRDFVFRK